MIRHLELARGLLGNHKADLAALRTDSPSPPPGSLSSFTSKNFRSQVYHSCCVFWFLTCSSRVQKLPSPTLWQSGRTQKQTRKLESQKRRKVEEESEPKRQKIRKSNIDVTSQIHKRASRVKHWADMHKLSCKNNPDYHRLVSKIEESLASMSPY